MDKNGKERIGLCLVVLPISKKIGEGLVKMLPDAFLRAVSGDLLFRPGDAKSTTDASRFTKH